MGSVRRQEYRTSGYLKTSSRGDPGDLGWLIPSKIWTLLLVLAPCIISIILYIDKRYMHMDEVELTPTTPSRFLCIFN